MGNMKFILKRIMHMDYKTMFQKIHAIHKKTGKSRLAIFRDMQDCAVKYGAGYMDYDLFEMYNLTPEQRDTYLTRGRNNALIQKYNDPAYGYIFDGKNEFNARFGDFIKRDWIQMTPDNKDDVLAFLSRHSVFVAKPLAGCCGKGIEKLNTSDFDSLEACYEYLTGQEAQFELEELILQHEAVSAIYPHAINTVRTVTIYDGSQARVVCTYFRIGNGGRHVDNFNSGGMVAPVDEKTGIVKDRAIDKQKNLYANHPETGATIQGFQFPYWEEAMELARQAAKVVPQIGYVGWDVAFTPDGPCLVEGNNYPGHDIYQLPEHTPDKVGMMVKFQLD